MLWYWSLQNLSEIEMKSRIRGVCTYMERFSYLFGCFVEKEVLSLTNHLSQCLQRSSLLAAEGQEITKHVVTGLVEKKNDECFDLLWNHVMKKKVSMRLLQSLLCPEKGKFHHDTISNGNEYFHGNPKLFYLQHYFDVVDSVAGKIKEQFDQPSYSIYIKLQNIILKASCCQDFRSELNSLEDLYKSEFNFFALKPQLELFPKFVIGKLEFSDTISLMKNLSTESVHYFQK